MTFWSARYVDGVTFMDEVTIINGKRFFCRQCGECCRHLNKVPEMRAYDRGDGICRFLADNRCMIYNQRPNLCRGEYLYHRYFEGIDVDEYYDMLYHYCDLIRRGNI